MTLLGCVGESNGKATTKANTGILHSAQNDDFRQRTLAKAKAATGAAFASMLG